MSIDPTSEHGSYSDEEVVLGPAVSRPGQMPPQVGGASDAPVPPFTPAAARPAAPAAAAPDEATGGFSGGATGAQPPEGRSDASEAAVDLTWLDDIDWGEEAAAEAPAAGRDVSDQPPAAEEVDAAAEVEAAAEVAEQAESEGLPPWISWVESEQEGDDKAEVQEVSALVEDYGELSEASAEASLDVNATAETSHADGYREEAFPAAAAETGQDVGEDASSAALREVADRLEGIAASLRGKTIAELLRDAPRADPLELLITGFVLGATTRGADEG